MDSVCNNRRNCVGSRNLFIATTVRKKKPTPDKDLLAELDSLKEKGLITEQEYNDKRAEIISRKGGKK